MALKVTTGKGGKVNLPTTHDELVKLCDKLGWKHRRGTTGTIVTSANGEAITIGFKMSSRTMNNVHAALHGRACIDEAIGAAARAEEAQRQKAIADDARRGDARRNDLRSIAARFMPPATSEVQQPNGHGDGHTDQMQVEDVESVVRSDTSEPITTTEPEPGIEWVTPQMAEEWLQCSPPTLADGSELIQRPILDDHVNEFVGIIDRCEWMVTHQGFALAPNEFPMDGRHRLTAIKRTGKRVRVMVSRNVDPNAFIAMDTNLRRTGSQLLHMAGLTNTTVLHSAAKLITVWRIWREWEEAAISSRRSRVPGREIVVNPYTAWKSWSRQTPTPQQILETIRNNHDALQHYLRAASRFRTKPMVASSAGIAAFMFAALECWPEGREHLDDFLQVIYTGLGLTEEKDPRHTLRQWLLNHNHRRWAGAGREVTLVAGILTWNKHCKREDMSQLKIAGDMDMPTPFVPR